MSARSPRDTIKVIPIVSGKRETSGSGTERITGGLRIDLAQYQYVMVVCSVGNISSGTVSFTAEFYENASGGSASSTDLITTYTNTQDSNAFVKEYRKSDRDRFLDIDRTWSGGAQTDWSLVVVLHGPKDSNAIPSGDYLNTFSSAIADLGMA